MTAASGCAPPMPPRPAVRIHLPPEVAAIVLAADLDEGLVGALHDALRADVDPRAGRHLAVHHQALAIELVEMVPGRPVRHEVGVGDQHARRVGMGAEHADRLAGLHQQRLVVLERLQRRDDAVETRPSRARPGRCRRRRPARSGSRRRPGSRLFISMRSGASVSQLLAVSSVPRGGADVADVVAGMWSCACPFDGRSRLKRCCPGERGFEDARQRGADRRRELGIVRRRPSVGVARAVAARAGSRGRRAPSAARGRRSPAGRSAA